MPSIRIPNEKSLMVLMNDEEAKRNVTDLSIQGVSDFSGSLSLSGFPKLQSLSIRTNIKDLVSMTISSISKVLSLINISSLYNKNRNCK